MPELPEVEQLTQGVRRAALGATFTAVEFFRDAIREQLDKDAITGVTVKQQIIAVTRRGKYMLIHTKVGALGIHLGMSGRFVEDLAPVASRPHTHVIFSFVKTDGQISYFHFVDPRRFGRVFSTTRDEAEQFSHLYLRNLGVEPLEAGAELWKHLRDACKRRQTSIKTLIMDSSVVVGVGNIYASESLWRARISPLRPASSLTAPQLKRLSIEIVKTLSEAIAAGGTTFRNYRNSDDKPGRFQGNLKVYEKDTEPCARCGMPIVKVVQAGRSTYFCPVCQK